MIWVIGAYALIGFGVGELYFKGEAYKPEDPKWLISMVYLIAVFFWPLIIITGFFVKVLNK